MANRGDSTQTSAMMMSPQCHASSHGAIRILDPPIAVRGQHLSVVPADITVSVLLGRPALEQVRRLHDRAVERDDERNLTRYRFPRLLDAPRL